MTLYKYDIVTCLTNYRGNSLFNRRLGERRNFDMEYKRTFMMCHMDDMAYRKRARDRQHLHKNVAVYLKEKVYGSCSLFWL